MRNVERLYTHRINVVRSTAVILDGVTTLGLHTVGVTYTQPVVVELQIPSGAATFTVTGLVNGLTSSNSVVFSSGSTIYKKQTTTAFNRLISIEGVTGTATTFSAKLMNKSGQPYFADTTVYSNLKCRIDNIGYGSPSVMKVGVQRPDGVVCFTNAPEGSIKVDDKVTQVSTTDTSGLGAASPYTYIVKNVDSFYNRTDYVYTELTLAKID